MNYNEYNDFPDWIQTMQEDELNFIKMFVLLSGSLKDVAKEYDVSYPTVRLRLDKIISKIKESDNQEKSTMEDLIKYLALEEKIDLETAKILLKTYRKEKWNICNLR